jgi:hypothetical protein
VQEIEQEIVLATAQVIGLEIARERVTVRAVAIVPARRIVPRVVATGPRAAIGPRVVEIAPRPPTAAALQPIVVVAEAIAAAR